jgi:hypothetical protein
MADLVALRADRDALEEAARLADVAGTRGERGAAREAERLHAEARVLDARIRRLEQTPDDALATLRQQWSALFAKLVAVDRKIHEIEGALHV